MFRGVSILKEDYGLENEVDFTNFSSALLDTLWLAGKIKTGIMMNTFKIKLE